MMNNDDDDSCSNRSTTSTTNSVGSWHNLCLCFLDQVRICSTAAPSAMDEAEEEEARTKLNMVNSSSDFLVISTDKLSIKYIGVNLHGRDVRAVAADKPAPAKPLLHYFEMHVKDSSVKGQF